MIRLFKHRQDENRENTEAALENSRKLIIKARDVEAEKMLLMIAFP